MSVINPNQYLPILSYPDQFFRHGLEYSVHKMRFSEQKSIAESNRNICRSLCQKAIKNTDDFPYIYFTAGATEGINYFFQAMDLQIFANEYRYVQTLPHSYQPTSDGIFYSNPFSGSGKLQNLSFEKNNIIDLTYLFATEMNQPITLPKQTCAALFSLSKSHNLADLRIGWILSKQMIPCFHVLQYDYGYINSLLSSVLAKIASEKLNYLYLKYNDRLQRLYKQNGLESTDTNLFALNKNGQRIPYYSLLKHGELLENI